MIDLAPFIGWYAIPSLNGRTIKFTFRPSLIGDNWAIRLEFACSVSRLSSLSSLYSGLKNQDKFL